MKIIPVLIVLGAMSLIWLGAYNLLINANSVWSWISSLLVIVIGMAGVDSAKGHE